MQQFRIKVYLPGSKQRIRRFALDIENDFQNNLTFDKFSKWLYNTCRVENSCNYKLKYMDTDKEWVTLAGTDSEWRECLNVLAEQKSPVLKIKISKNSDEKKTSHKEIVPEKNSQKEAKRASVCHSTSVEDLQQTIASILQKNAGEKSDIIVHDVNSFAFPEPVEVEDKVCFPVKQMLQEILDREEEQNAPVQYFNGEQEFVEHEQPQQVEEEQQQNKVEEVKQEQQQPYFILPSATAVDASPYGLHLKLLSDMGIGTPETILPLLVKYKGNIERVVDEYYRTSVK